MKNNYLSLLLISLIIFFLGSISLFGQIDTSDVFDKHKIRVKFKKENRAALQIQQKNLKRSAKQKGCGVTSVDALNEKHRLKGMNQAFPCLRASLQAKHERHGIDLWYEIEVDDEVTEELIKEYAKNESIEIAEPLYKVKPMFVPNDPRSDDQWTLLNTESYGANIQTESAWDLETGSNNVIVAVIDSGINYTHEDLADAMWVNEAEVNGVDGVDDDGNGVVDDFHGITFYDGGAFTPIEPGDHGTHIAGIIGAVSNNGVGIAGIAGGNGTAQGVRLMSCQTRTPDDQFSYGSGERALIYAADNGAVIVSISWGSFSPTIGVQEAINYFVDTAGTDDNGNQIGPMVGGLVIAAAGNYNSSQETYPAAYDNVMAVSSTDSDNVRAGNSSYGSWVDISAPGVSTYSTQASNDSDYSYGSGTSYAAPHVAGVAALLVSKYQYEGITADQVEEALINSTDNIDEENPIYVGLLGSGRLNAYSALNYGLGFNCDVITDPYATIEAESFCEQFGIKTNTANTFVGWIDNGDWINFSLDFGDDRANSISVSVASATNGGTIEIRKGSPTGISVGAISVENTGGWEIFEQKTITISNLTGKQNLYFVFTGGNGGLLNVDWLKFNEPECESYNAFSVIEAEAYCEQQGVKVYENNGVTKVGSISDGDWVKYNNIDFGTGVDGLEVSTSAYGNGGSLEFRLDAITGASIGVVYTGNTGDWDSFETFDISIDEVDGIHDVYVVFDTYGYGGSFDFDSFTFSSSVEPPVETFIPDPNKKYYIDVPHHNLRLAADGEEEFPETEPIGTTGADVEWQFVAKGNGSWHIQRAAGGTLPRLRTDNTSEADMQGTAWSGTYTYYDFEGGAIDGTYFITLTDGPANFKRLQVNNGGEVKMVTTASNGTWESFRITEVIDNSTSCSSGTNLALNATVVDYSAQQDSTNGVVNILDGSDGNRWSASGFPQYAVVDLGAAYSVNEINLSTFTNRDYQFTVEGSLASASSGFSMLVDASNNSDFGPINRSFPIQTVRYVKLTVTGANSYTGTWSSVTDFEIICAGSSSSKEISASAEMSDDILIYPNPVTSETIINNAANSVLNICDVNGRIVLIKAISSESETINLSGLAPGIYYAKLRRGAKTKVVRILKE